MLCFCVICVVGFIDKPLIITNSVTSTSYQASITVSSTESVRCGAYSSTSSTLTGSQVYSGTSPSPKTSQLNIPVLFDMTNLGNTGIFTFVTYCATQGGALSAASDPVTLPSLNNSFSFPCFILFFHHIIIYTKTPPLRSGRYLEVWTHDHKFSSEHNCEFPDHHGLCGILDKHEPHPR